MLHAAQNRSSWRSLCGRGRCARSRYAAKRGGRHPSPRRGGSVRNASASVHTRTVNKEEHFHRIDFFGAHSWMDREAPGRIRSSLQALIESGMHRHTLITEMAKRGHDRPDDLDRLAGLWDQVERDIKYWEARRRARN